jgi:hypothetical protein
VEVLDVVEEGAVEDVVDEMAIVVVTPPENVPPPSLTLIMPTFAKFVGI